jgi:hypothetical protein
MPAVSKHVPRCPHVISQQCLIVLCRSDDPLIVDVNHYSQQRQARFYFVDSKRAVEPGSHARNTWQDVVLVLPCCIAGSAVNSETNTFSCGSQCLSLS